MEDFREEVVMVLVETVEVQGKVTLVVSEVHEVAFQVAMDNLEDVVEVVVPLGVMGVETVGVREKVIKEGKTEVEVKVTVKRVEVVKVVYSEVEVPAANLEVVVKGVEEMAEMMVVEDLMEGRLYMRDGNS